ncbi:sulfotransferase [Oleiagrimonas sp. MCCC 1A03011]|uniref:sulfotransferase family protein n=1 Tax=Oleiagrimonas sp. MCCC 1A03011 TaxID=1926883 RepID=UPI000DD636E0|nr:sulfotransferase [Oleiagrimonas sp. MCCC 1A03011]
MSEVLPHGCGKDAGSNGNATYFLEIHRLTGIFMTMTASSPVRKIFVVGCPRSGTTVIQALLAERPDVLSFGETNYMLRLLGHFDRWLQDDRSAAKKWRRRLRLARGKTHGDMRRCLDNAFKAYDDVPGLRRKLSGRGYIREFCRILDAMALERGCSCWVEKTPDHLAYLDVLEKEVPEAHFLHVLRKGEDVMASVLDGQLRYSRHNVFAGSLPYWVRRWRSMSGSPAGRDTPFCPMNACSRRRSACVSFCRPCPDLPSRSPLIREQG